jgi:hypothetical protein
MWNGTNASWNVGMKASIRRLAIGLAVLAKIKLFAPVGNRSTVFQAVVIHFSDICPGVDLSSSNDCYTMFVKFENISCWYFLAF